MPPSSSIASSCGSHHTTPQLTTQSPFSSPPHSHVCGGTCVVRVCRACAVRAAFRYTDVQKALAGDTAHISPAHLKDFDWKLLVLTTTHHRHRYSHACAWLTFLGLQHSLASDKVATVNEPILRLNLTIKYPPPETRCCLPFRNAHSHHSPPPNRLRCRMCEGTRTRR